MPTSTVQRLEYQIGMGASGFLRGVQAVVGGLRQMGSRVVHVQQTYNRATERITRGLESVKQRTDQVAQASRKAQLTLVALAGVMTVGASKTAAYADQMKGLSEQTGLTTDEIQALGYAAEQSNADLQLLATGLRAFVRRAAEAARGNASFRKEFERIGVSVLDADGQMRSTMELLVEVADRVQQMGSEAEASATMMNLMSDAGRQLVPFIRQGGRAIRELTQEAERLGLVMDDAAVQRWADLNDAMDGLRARAGALGRDIMTEFLPAFELVVGWVGQAVDWFRDLDDETKDQVVRWGLMATGVLGVVAVLGLLSNGVSLALQALTLLAGGIAFLLSPLGIGLMLLIAGGTALWTAWNEDWGGLRTKITEWAEKVGSALKGLSDWFATTKLGQAVEKFVADLKKIWQDEELTFGEKVVKSLRLIPGGSWVIDFVADVQAIWAREDLTLGEKVVETIRLLPGGQWIAGFIERLEELWAEHGDQVQLVVRVILRPFGDLYDAIKTGLTTGDWSGIWGVAAEAWRAGVKLAVSLYLVTATVRSVLTAITTGLGLARAGLAALGAPGVIGALSVAIALMEAREGGGYQAFGANLIAALAAGIGIGVFTGSPSAGALAFTIVLNFEIGSWIGDKLEQLREWVGDLPPAWRLSLSESRNVELRRELGYQTGGIIPGHRRGDRVPILAEEGEAVVPRDVVRQGLGAIIAWFLGQGVRHGIRGFQTGGLVGVDPTLAAGIEQQRGILSGVEDSLTSMARTFMGGLMEAFDLLVKLLEAIGKGLLGEQKWKEFQAVIEAGKAKLQEFIDTLTGARDEAEDAADALRDQFTEGVKAPLAPAQQLRLALILAGKRLRNTMDAIGRLPGRAWDAIKGMPGLIARGWSGAMDLVGKGWRGLVAGLQSVTAKALDWITGGWRKTLADVGSAALDFAQRTLTGLGNMILASAPIAEGVARGAVQGMQAGGPAGAAAGALLALLGSSQKFGELMQRINPILQAFADVVGAMLGPLIPVAQLLAELIEPVLQQLAPAFQVLGEIMAAILLPVVQAFAWVMETIVLPIFEFVAKIIAGVWNALANAINWALGWLGVRVPTIKVQKADTSIDTGAGDTGGGDKGGSGGPAFAELAGPARELLVELLRPLARLDTWTGYFERIVTFLSEIRDVLAAGFSIDPLAEASQAMRDVARDLGRLVTDGLTVQPSAQLALAGGGGDLSLTILYPDDLEDQARLDALAEKLSGWLGRSVSLRARAQRGRS